MTFIIDIITKSSLLMLLILFILPLLKNKSAGLRHWVISLGMLSLLVLPLGRLCLPDLELALLPSEELSEQSIASNQPVVSPQELRAPISSQVRNQDQIESRSESTPISTSTVSTASLPQISIWQIIGISILLTSFFFLFRFLLGLLAIHQIASKGHHFHHPDLKLILTEVEQKFAPLAPVQILSSKLIHTPMTWGLQHAKIALPQNAVYWNIEELRTVILHEMAHIYRQDYQMHLISQLAACLYWFNPLFWILKNRQLLEREKACDELVVSKGVQPHDYAEQLISFAKRVNYQHNLASSFALPMAQPSQMKQRILAILNFKPGAFLNAAIAKRKWAFLFACTLPLLAAVSLVAKPLSLKLPTLLPSIKEEQKEAVIEPEEFASEEDSNDTETLVAAESDIDSASLEEEPKLKVDSINLQSPPVLLEKLSFKTLQPQAKEESEAKINGWYGHWKDGATHYTVWTYGDYKLMDIFPYIEPFNASDIVIVETQKGDAKHAIALTRTPFDGGLIQDFRNGEPNAWSGFLKDDLLIMQFENEEWIFSFMKTKKWSKKLNTAAKQLQNLKDQSIWQSAEAKPNYWRPVIDKYKGIKEKRYHPYEELVPHIQNQVFKTLRNEASKKPLSSLPYQAATQSIVGGKEKTLGYTDPSRTTSGFSGYEGKGYKFGTIIKGNNKVCQLKEFNFHVQHVTFKEVEYQLHLFAVEDGKPTHSLIPKPIPGTLSSTKKDWISLNLRPYNVISGGEDILAVIELTHTPKKGGFFLSNINYIKGMFLPRTDLSEYDIWSERFTFYFTAEY